MPIDLEQQLAQLCRDERPQLDLDARRHARPAHVLQLCFYTEQVARIQGRMPDAMHVVNGLGGRESFRVGDYMAYYRRLRQRFLDAVAARADSYPYPVEHCGICDFLSLCQRQWEEDDHLVLVANPEDAGPCSSATSTNITRGGAGASGSRGVCRADPGPRHARRHLRPAPADAARAGAVALRRVSETYDLNGNRGVEPRENEGPA